MVSQLFLLPKDVEYLRDYGQQGLGDQDEADGSQQRPNLGGLLYAKAVQAIVTTALRKHLIDELRASHLCEPIVVGDCYRK